MLGAVFLHYKNPVSRNLPCRGGIIWWIWCALHTENKVNSVLKRGGLWGMALLHRPRCLPRTGEMEFILPASLTEHSLLISWGTNVITESSRTTCRGNRQTHSVEHTSSHRILWKRACERWPCDYILIKPALMHSSWAPGEFLYCRWAL